MLDHVGLTCTDIARSTAFYTAALAPLGITLVMEVSAAQTGAHDHAGFGRDGKPFLWVGNGPGSSAGTHVALACPDRAAVDAFHAAALAAGGTDNGAPGLRPWYHPDYYAAFALDPDGANIEAVCHLPG
ncbi:VOC family protein [Stenotrophomonas sp. 24(2023)]|uniref:VOC family protein n=1 Tax=Stenotrophomonas sp. 24(2023) TaxID=3068324 RepID=UPI0027DF8B50|nr:VOC family protein [Stenotrophomonas sp. 24(2023)]WMJ69036.1 VOC family protein [Stenotrophomonas sp. 24(2023)]